MKIKFWGVRGSIACPGPDTVEFGGNTTCIELWFEEVNRLFVIDAGSGIRLLGDDIQFMMWTSSRVFQRSSNSGEINIKGPTPCQGLTGIPLPAGRNPVINLTFQKVEILNKNLSG